MLVRSVVRELSTACLAAQPKKKVQWLWLTADTSLERDLAAGCALGGASRAMGKGKEEEGTEPGLCDPGLFSAGLEAAETPIVPDW